MMPPWWWSWRWVGWQCCWGFWLWWIQYLKPTTKSEPKRIPDKDVWCPRNEVYTSNNLQHVYECNFTFLLLHRHIQFAILLQLIYNFDACVWLRVQFYQNPPFCRARQVWVHSEQLSHHSITDLGSFNDKEYKCDIFLDAYPQLFWALPLMIFPKGSKNLNLVNK